MTKSVLDRAAISSPKRTRSARHPWYDYYAGYSASFAVDVVDALLPQGDGVKRVLDPWNGSGTTTLATTLAGHHAVGIDRNPALVVIAKGRHLPVSVRKSIEPLARDIVGAAERLMASENSSIARDDELGAWFTRDACRRLRMLERAINQVLVMDAAPKAPHIPATPARLSTLAAFFYCALFTVVRQLTASFRTSNPTWVRRARDPADLVECDWSATTDAFLAASLALAERLVLTHDTSETAAELRLGSAERLRLDKKVDLTLGSPPYCTRIDYVVATRPELAVLGYSAARIEALRRRMLGTPLTHDGGIRIEARWGRSAGVFLNAVRSHRSKASGTYYFRYYRSYLETLYASIERLDRVTRRDGTIALVVQDSYYKEAHFDLPAIVAEMGERLGRSGERIDFPVATTKAAIHPGARAYRTTFGAVESLVVLSPRGT